MTVQVPDAAVGTVVAAFIAGVISFLGLIVSKEQKISEFRQSWIDELRKDISNVLTGINAINDAISVEYTKHSDKVEALGPLYRTLNSSTFNILLRINYEEVKSQNLIAALNSINLITAEENKITSYNIRIIENEVLESSRILLKNEWRRVKSGELIFRFAKFTAAVIVGVSIFGAVIIALMRWSDEIWLLTDWLKNNAISYRSK